MASLLAGVAACNGTAVVTLAGTVPQNGFLAYRVGLASVALKTTDGKTTVQVLPAEMTVDLAGIGGTSLVLGAAAAAKGSYGSAVITLDFSAAQIIADDGSLNGVALTPVGTSGQSLGKIQITTELDPANLLSISTGDASRLALNINLAASSSINLVQKTVTCTPMIAASALAIDGNPVMVRGPVSSVDTANSDYVTGIAPFAAAGVGTLTIAPGGSATYEINGTASTGAAGLAQLAALGPGTLAVAYGSFTSGTTATVGAGATFAATQVLAGSSVQGSGFDRLSGIVSARSGDTLTVEDGTLIANDGTNSLFQGTSVVELGTATAVTLPGQGSAVVGNGIQQISVGSRIDAFGLSTVAADGAVTLDASAGRIRLGNADASGLVTAQGSGELTLSLTSLGGRSAAAFDFSGTGTAATNDATADGYVVGTGALDLANSTPGAPVEATGMVAPFGAAPPDFSATALLDPTTLNAELVVDWGAGSAMPFVQFTSAEIDVNVHDPAIGPRHTLALGPQQIDITGLTADPLLVPSAAALTVFTIGHAASATFENFNAYADFVTALQKYLNGTTVATGMTAEGLYSASTSTLTATAITLYLSD
jgi:hypothetical protein